MHDTLITRTVTCTKSSDLQVVLLHGWGMNSGIFDEFTPLLSDVASITTIDLPGFGCNQHVVPVPYSLENVAAVVAERLPTKCVVLGWSLGGLLAQSLALSHSDKVMGLITIASTPQFVAEGEWPGIAPRVLAQFEAQLGQNYAQTLDRFLAIQAMGSATAKQDIKRIRQALSHYPEPSRDALAEGLKLLSSENLRAKIADIEQPTLRLYGRLDSLVPHQAIPLIQALQPAAQSLTLAHASHAPFISHAEETAQTIRTFLCANFSVC